MIRRTKGYILLTLLVLTGMASRNTGKTLSYKERTAIVKELKAARQELVQALEATSTAQWHSGNAAAMACREYYVQLSRIQEALMHPAPENLVRDVDALPVRRPQWKTPANAIKDIKGLRPWKIARTTTEDLHAQQYRFRGQVVDGYALFAAAAELERKMTEVLRWVEAEAQAEVEHHVRY